MLKGKISFVTGSTRGIGWATARTFAAQGATVILNGRASQQRLDERVAEIRREFNVPCVGFLADASDPSAVRVCYLEIFKQFKRLDVLVNNAGILRDALLGMISDAMISETMAVNTFGVMYHLQEASRLMLRHLRGSIINVTSIVGRFGSPGETVYSGSKAALIGVTLSAAKELAPKNIRVNAVAPGFIDTDLTRSLPPDKFGQWERRIGMGRVGDPQDVANAILFLASDLSTYITGQVLGVDGALTL